MSNLYIGNLSYKVTEKEIRELFSEFGEIESVKLFADKGFGFVNFLKDVDTKKILQELNDKIFLGREMKVDLARPQKKVYPDRYKS